MDATAYLAPYPARRVRRPVRLVQAPGSYPIEPSAEDSWLRIVFEAFSRLNAKIDVRELLIVGTGNGLDALGAIEIFDLRSLVATDLRAACASAARRNVLAHLAEGVELELSFPVGDLLACVRRAKPFCLMYENLPNLRAPEGMELASAELAGRYFRAENLRAPQLFESHMLALHHECLRQARRYLRSGGGALTALGGRVPLTIAFDLHRSCGYEPELVELGLKLQSEPGLVLPTYCEAEQRFGVEFRFYVAEAMSLAGQGRKSGEEPVAVEGRLDGFAISAKEALRRHRRGESVAHSVFMIFGRVP
jgi:hypothetical protein